MKVQRALAHAMIRKHPQRAATALEMSTPEEAARMLEALRAAEIAPVLRRMTPQFGARVLEALGTEKMNQVLDALHLNVAARLVRRIPDEKTHEALAQMTQPRGRALEALLRFPEGSAGALMDPEVLAVPETLTAREALRRIRETPANARYNVYVVDDSQRLSGVVNLREILLANPNVRLADFMVRDPQRLDAYADRATVVAHPGWREVHALPVVDDEGCYLGAIRFRTLRALESELFGRARADADTRESLGQLFAAGAGALLDAFATTPSEPTGRTATTPTTPTEEGR